MRRAAVVVGLLALAGCARELRVEHDAATAGTSGTEVPTPAPPLNRFVLVEIGSATVAPYESSSGVTWDPDAAGADAAQRERESSAVVGLVSLVNPAAGGALELLSALGAPSPPREASPTLPDPYFRVATARGSTTTEVVSHVELNTTTPTWRLEYWIDLDDLYGEGLRVTVEDADGAEAGHTRIGEVVVPLADLEHVAASLAPRDVVLADGDLAELRVHLSAPIEAPPREQEVAFQFRSGLAPTGLHTPMGALVTVAVTGGGRVATGAFGSCARDPDVDTQGVGDGGCTSYNLPLFGRSLHAVPVMLWGSGSETSGIDLAAPPGTCLLFVAPRAGEVVVGINDRDLGNDSGQFTFHVSVAPPSPDIELEPGQAAPCVDED